MQRCIEIANCTLLMRKKTAVFILQDLARRELLTVEHTTFVLASYPQPVDPEDVRDAFECLRDAMGFTARALHVTQRIGLLVWTSDRFFEKLFKLIFVNQKLYPVKRSDNVEGLQGAPLPNLFVNSEKTQVRQIPLVETPPWPWKFLLELGGMVVVRPQNERDMILSLRQFLNNHPQFRIKVDAKKWEDGSIAIFTWWFAHMPDKEKRGNVNVPS